MNNPQVQFAVNMDDGTVAVIAFMTEGRSPTLPFGAVWKPDGSGLWYREPSDVNVFAELSKAFPSVDMNGLPKPQPVSYKRIEIADLPQDRTYRNALTFDGEAFDHDIEKAKDIQLDLVRRARTVELGKLDVEWMKAVGQGDNKKAQEIEAKRQSLRDAPQTLDMSQVANVEELKAIWPADLPKV
ncbi:hypothetical protein UFOVP1672_12 [uncultured Caudovirales phage]|uniref:Uncharacterized protein n=1 Tax=uncultured Caudovirales phage TaxID=2100421 RepID=A0A6J5PX21_9CAUD|nr:hypothetical protein UFOVP988_34 [uncultured Caudovirales phage]CAB4210716.1 hypothetical protein UFOVP1425_34 [uncultured Caudovirales phage]CAB4223288.1 hypothetical protein UFOVP1672_12 [uncultured Caudovirales phage]